VKEQKQMSRTHYFAELESVRQKLVEMGETTLALFDEAVLTVSEPNAACLAKAGELEAKTDHQHRQIHDQCLNLITLQAPVARDARFVTGTLDAIVDLELIGDYSYEIATLASGLRRRPPSRVLAQISEVTKRVREVMAKVIDAWRSEDSAQGASVLPQESAIRAECAALFEKLEQLTSEAGEIRPRLDSAGTSRRGNLLEHSESARGIDGS
jgi:phosphate transport system protein